MWVTAASRWSSSKNLALPFARRAAKVARVGQWKAAAPSKKIWMSSWDAPPQQWASRTGHFAAQPKRLAPQGRGDEAAGVPEEGRREQMRQRCRLEDS